MVPVGVCHYLERFYLGVDMLNYYPLPGKPLIVRFFPFGKLVMFTRLFWYSAVRVQFFYPKITQIRVYANVLRDIRSDSFLVYFEVMNTTFFVLF
jgi:hypothetical protein